MLFQVGFLKSTFFILLFLFCNTSWAIDIKYRRAIGYELTEKHPKLGELWNKSKKAYSDKDYDEVIKNNHDIYLYIKNEKSLSNYLFSSYQDFLTSKSSYLRDEGNENEKFQLLDSILLESFSEKQKASFLAIGLQYLRALRSDSTEKYYEYIDSVVDRYTSKEDVFLDGDWIWLRPLLNYLSKEKHNPGGLKQTLDVLEVFSKSDLQAKSKVPAMWSYLNYLEEKGNVRKSKLVLDELKGLILSREYIENAHPIDINSTAQRIKVHTGNEDISVQLLTYTLENNSRLDNQTKAKFENSLYSVFYSIENYEKALFHIEKTLLYREKFIAEIKRKPSNHANDRLLGASKRIMRIQVKKYAQLLIKTESFDKAISVISEQVGKNKDDRALWTQYMGLLGDTYFYEKKYQDAFNIFSEALDSGSFEKPNARSDKEKYETKRFVAERLKSNPALPVDDFFGSKKFLTLVQYYSLYNLFKEQPSYENRIINDAIDIIVSQAGDNWEGMKSYEKGSYINQAVFILDRSLLVLEKPDEIAKAFEAAKAISALVEKYPIDKFSSFDFYIAYINLGLRFYSDREKQKKHVNSFVDNLLEGVEAGSKYYLYYNVLRSYFLSKASPTEQELALIKNELIHDLEAIKKSQGVTSFWYKKSFDLFEKFSTEFHMSGESMMEVVKLKREELAIAKENHGLESKKYAKALINLAKVLASSAEKNSELEEAAKLSRQALLVYRLNYHETHYSLSYPLNAVANVLEEKAETKEQFKEVIDLYKESLNILKLRVREIKSSFYASVLNNLASVLNDQAETKEQFKEVEDLYRQSLAIRVKAVGKNHPDYALAINNLASVLNDQAETKAQFKEVEDLYRQSLAIREKAVGKNHPDYALAINNLASVLNDQAETKAQFKEVADLYRQSLATLDMVFSKSHRKYIFTLYAQALAYEKSQETLKARSTYQNVAYLCNLNSGRDLQELRKKVVAKLEQLASTKLDPDSVNRLTSIYFMIQQSFGLEIINT